MAKKNSSKTATKEALQASEPRVSTIGQWGGIFLRDTARNYDVHYEDNGSYDSHLDDSRQIDLQQTYNLIQNNLSLAANKTIETRADESFVLYVAGWLASNGCELTGIFCLYKNILFAACHDNAKSKDRLIAVDVRSNAADGSLKEITGFTGKITDANVFDDELVIMTDDVSTSYSNIYFSKTKMKNDDADTVSSVPTSVYKISNCGTPSFPSGAYCEVTTHGDITISKSYTSNCPNRFQLKVALRSRLGSTKATYVPIRISGTNYSEFYTNIPAEQMTTSSYLNFSFKMYSSSPTPSAVVSNHDIYAIDVYYTTEDNYEFTWAMTISDHNVTAQSGNVYITAAGNWYGGGENTETRVTVPLFPPEETTFTGSAATKMRVHDGKVFMWGVKNNLSRVYWCGRPGHEFSIARTVGGGYLDVSPAGNTVVHGTAKFKTYNGASIVTVMCGHKNSDSIKRFNLLEVNSTITNEISNQAYEFEEVSNVVGCNSDFGFGVFADGLYSLHRYGLTVTTQAMESSNQLRTQKVSDAIEPVFYDVDGTFTKTSQIVYIDDVVYMIPSQNTRIIFCYDMENKAWWTWTVSKPIVRLFHMDYIKHKDGLGIIYKDGVSVIPITQEQDAEKPPAEFTTLLETAELTSRQPLQSTTFLCQLELRFDYLVGHLDVLIEGTDYYGRPFKVYKKIDRETMENNAIEWIRVDKLVESYRMKITGKARYRMTHVNVKSYVQSSKINLPYGFDDHIWFTRRDGIEWNIHHYIKDYNNLKEAIVT